MSEQKSFASLGPTLLARKGGARPAMRSQVQGLATVDVPANESQEDLGWNDMGDGHTADVLPLTVPPTNLKAEAETAESAKPPVVLQQESVAERIANPVPAKKEPAKPRRSALKDGRRAAFTLRVDAERHLKMRLACTIRNSSAQQLVTEALDKLLADMPDLETLAAQVKR